MPLRQRHWLDLLKVDQDTAAFLVTADSQLQMVLLWNRSTERLLEIFNTANLSLERPPQITAIASDGTYLYYLMKEMDGSNWLQLQFNKRVGFVEEESSIAGI